MTEAGSDILSRKYSALLPKLLLHFQQTTDAKAIGDAFCPILDGDVFPLFGGELGGGALANGDFGWVAEEFFFATGAGFVFSY